MGPWWFQLWLVHGDLMKRKCLPLADELWWEFSFAGLSGVIWKQMLIWLASPCSDTGWLQKPQIRCRTDHSIQEQPTSDSLGGSSGPHRLGTHSDHLLWRWAKWPHLFTSTPRPAGMKAGSTAGCTWWWLRTDFLSKSESEKKMLNTICSTLGSA